VNAAARRWLGCLAAAGIVITTAVPVAAASPTAAEDSFEIHARPLLVAHCIRCHGETKQDARGAAV